MTDVMDKVRAILRKAEESSNPSEEERDTAMRMAQRILLKHGLTMADVGDISDDETSAGRKFQNESILTTEGRDEAWRGLLIERLGSVYFCRPYRMALDSKGRRHSWFLVGRADHVKAAVSMYEFVAPQLVREFTKESARMGLYWRYARQYAERVAEQQELNVPDLSDEELGTLGADNLARVKEDLDLNRQGVIHHVANTLGISEGYAANALPRIRAEDIAPSTTDNLGVWRRSWFDGAVIRVSARLRKLMQEETENLGEPGTDLVRNEKAATEDYLDSLDLGLRTRQSSRQTDYAGRASGDRAGKRADLSGHRKVGAIRKELGA